MMFSLLTAFKAVSNIFSLAAVGTGLQGIFDPIGFSKTFGLPLPPSKSSANSCAYVSLMGIRQLATGTLLMVFNSQDKYIEAATVLAIIGVLVAGTDGFHLAKAGEVKAGAWHAGPGFAIAGLAGAVLWYET